MGNTGITAIRYESSPLPQIALPSHGRISDGDARLLLHIASITYGDIVEIGCHAGGTTRMLAEANPGRHVYGIDWSGPRTSDIDQGTDYLPHNKLGHEALHLPNVTIIDGISWNVAMPAGADMIFIDGDHSMRGLVRDFASVVLNCGRGTKVVFHDYYPDAPKWCAVNDFINGFLSRHQEVFHITGTNCAWIEI